VQLMTEQTNFTTTDKILYEKTIRQ
jgi:hypothetical protein